MAPPQSRDPFFDPPRLAPEMIPKSSWGVNVRTILDDPDLWQELREDALHRHGRFCAACGAYFGNPAGRYHAHERWSYEDGIQELTDIVPLCHLCHEVVHIGRAHATGNFERAVNHFQRVNRMGKYEAKAFLDMTFMEWAQRNERTWEVRIDWAIERLKKLE